MWHNSLRKEYIPMIDIYRLFLIKLPKDILVLNKEKLSYNLFFIGIVIAFYGSINPWFMWPLGKYYAILSCVFVLSSMFISATLKKPIFNKNNYLLSIVSYIVLVYYQSFVNEESLTSYIYHLFNICIFFSIFRINQRGIQRLSTLLAKSMGYLLSISMPFFAEGYINFGYVGIFLFTVFLAFISAFLDKNYWNGRDPRVKTWFTPFYLVFIGAALFIMRGDLMSSFSYTLATLFDVWIVTKLAKIGKKRA